MSNFIMHAIGVGLDGKIRNKKSLVKWYVDRRIITRSFVLEMLFTWIYALACRVLLESSIPRQEILHRTSLWRILRRICFKSAGIDCDYNTLTQSDRQTCLIQSSIELTRVYMQKNASFSLTNKDIRGRQAEDINILCASKVGQLL